MKVETNVTRCKDCPFFGLSPSLHDKYFYECRYGVKPVSLRGLNPCFEIWGKCPIGKEKFDNG